jgi:hypothetical protein
MIRLLSMTALLDDGREHVPVRRLGTEEEIQAGDYILKPNEEWDRATPETSCVGGTVSDDANTLFPLGMFWRKVI